MTRIAGMTMVTGMADMTAITGVIEMTGLTRVTTAGIPEMIPVSALF